VPVFPLLLLFVTGVQSSFGTSCLTEGHGCSTMGVLMCWGIGSLTAFVLVARDNRSMATSLAMKGCMAVWTAAVSVTTSRGMVCGGGASGTLGSGVAFAGCTG